MEIEDRLVVCETIREKTFHDDSSASYHLPLPRSPVRERRNSIPTITSILNFTAAIPRSSRASVPNISYHGSTSLHNSPSLRSRFKLYNYIKAGAVDQTYNELYKLDDTFALIRNQLNSLSEENRTVRNRVHSLTEAVTELCTHFSSSATDDEEDDDSYDNDFTDDYYDHDTLHDTNIPFQRIHSLPAPLTNGWHEEEEEENEDEKDVASLSWHFDTNHELISRRILPCIITVDSTSQEYDDTSEEEIAIGKDEDLYSH